MASDSKMRANVFHGVNDIRVEEVQRPRAGPGEAVIRVTLTTICGTDLHILRGEYPVRPGLVIGHEPVGVIEELGPGVTGYKVGDRVLVGAITPCGQCEACLSGHLSQCGHGARLRGDRRLAVRQHDQRRAGRVPPRPVRPGEPREDPRRPDRRAGRPAGRHRLDRLRRGRVRRREDRRRRRRLRPGADRPVRDGRREADGGVAGHRRGRRRRRGWRCHAGWAPTSRSTSATATWLRRSRS